MKTSGVLLLCLLQLVVLVASQDGHPTNTTTPPTNVTLPTVRIDTHCHLVPPFYKALLNSRNLTAGGRPIPTWNASAHLALGAQLGVVTSIFSISTPGAKLAKDDPVEDGRTLARQLNEYAYNVTLQYPKRFFFFATLTLPDVEGAVAEAIYALDKLNAAGVILLASTFGELLGTPRYAPLYEVLNQRNATVFIHPSDSPCPPAPDASPNTTTSNIPPFVIDFLLDTTRAAINLVYRNVTRDYPNITFILAHSGGFLPFAANRAAGGLALLSGQPTAVPGFLKELASFHVDIALSASPFALASTTAFFNSSLITFGSDFPYAPSVGILQNTNGLSSFPLSKAVADQINYLNALKLIKKFLLKP